MKYTITRKEALNAEDFLIEVEAPLVAKKFKAGQFLILRIHDKGERIPLTITDCDPEKGLVRMIIKAVGKTTSELGRLGKGDSVSDIVGPLGNPSEIKKFGTVVCIGGGTGIACLYPIIKALKAAGNHVVAIIGARTKDKLVWEDEIKTICDDLIVTTDDGSYGRKGVVTEPLEEILKNKTVDRVIAIGPMIMMKFVAKTTESYGVKTVVSLNTIMIDGTGMCGGCRVFIGGEMKFTCIDGPEFDGHKVNFDELMNRLDMFKEKEKQAMEYYERGTK
ncbi:MAG: sulfide/dihydroorotate dehydrogenase-like FAD/NAD-binding protein [Candidatus Bathyarchaeota archaeon]|nr:sulfide/dihydroorotate dehydrogenase-like FAD/NAD-binding protein [Candidatus Bathyarchaeota archaeon]